MPKYRIRKDHFLADRERRSFTATVQSLSGTAFQALQEPLDDEARAAVAGGRPAGTGPPWRNRPL
jgi:hypothetical protein